MTKQERQKVAEYITQHPELSYPQLAAVYDRSWQWVASIAQEFGIRRKTGRKAKTGEQK